MTETWGVLVAKQSLLTALVAFLLMVSAVSVIYSSHQSRQLFNEWQMLQKEAYQLDEDWGRLLLEHSTWAAPDRIARLAGERLMMVAPSKESFQVVTVHGEAN
ncbi:MAG: cell division protein FtsL [Paracoccaceae bacterium]|jgi:cell division protein FtsL